jgi:hypothetical protein
MVKRNGKIKIYLAEISAKRTGKKEFCLNFAEMSRQNETKQNKHVQVLLRVHVQMQVHFYAPAVLTAVLHVHANSAMFKFILMSASAAWN